MDVRGAARRLAGLLAAEEPEPKVASLGWSLAAAATSHPPRIIESEQPSDAPHVEAGRRYSALEAARHEVARRTGSWPARSPERAALERARGSYFRKHEGETVRDPSAAIPDLAEPEALVTFANLDGDIHAWVVRSPAKVVAHHRLLTASDWRESASSLAQQLQDARGWPDAIIPETLIRSSQTLLRELGTRLWTPLWPALSGAARILIAPDGSLPLLPFTALILAAEPSSWPRPRAVSLVPDPGAPRSRRWRTPNGRAYAVATRDPILPVSQREAQGVVRVIGGEVAALFDLRSDERGERRELSRSLRKARLFHVAAPVYTLADHPGFSFLDLGDELLPLWWLARESRSLRLIVLPDCACEGPATPALGRVVGAIGPEGVKRVRGPSTRVQPHTGLYDLSRFLLDAGIERVVMSVHCGDEGGPSAVLSTFYAGLARGDTPSEALFLAQRNAWSEEIHPVLWSGYSCWGWP
jgi:hypothetical protein